jgi:hypothetical protein
MKYCSSKVILETKLPDQKFFRNLCQRDFDYAAPASPWSIWLEVPQSDEKSVFIRE